MSDKITLSADQRALSLNALMKLFSISKATAHRAKSRGWFRKGHHNSKAVKQGQEALQASLPPAPVLKPGLEVRLSADELKLTVEALQKRYGVGEHVAVRAKKTGIMSRRNNYTPLTKIPSPQKWRRAKPQHYDPEHPFFRVNLAPAEMSMKLDALMILYAAFGISKEMASQARRRGYFCPNVGMKVLPCIDEKAFAAVQGSLLEEARHGSFRALRKFYGSDWGKKLRGITFDDVVAAALERLHNRSGKEGFESAVWRKQCAYYGALEYIGKEAKRRKKESTTVDQLEGRFQDDQ